MIKSPRNKFILFLISSLVILTTVVTVAAFMENDFIKVIGQNANSTQTSYQIVLNDQNKLTTGDGAGSASPGNDCQFSRYTKTGYDLKFRGGKMIAPTGTDDSFVFITKSTAYIANDTDKPIHGLSNITINLSTFYEDRSTYHIVYFSDSPLWESVPLGTPFVSKELEKSAKRVSLSFDVPCGSSYCYFRYQTNETIDINFWIKSVTVCYSCTNDPTPHKYIHKDKVDKNRGTDGLEEHYECSNCDKYFDLDYKETTKENLTIKNTLVNVEEATATQKDSTYIPFTWSLNKILYLDVLVDSDSQGIYIGFMDKNNGWKRTVNAKIMKDASFSFSDYPTGVASTTDGVYILGKTTDDYVRFKFDLSKIAKETGFISVTDILIYKWAHSSGKIDINPSANIKTTEYVMLTDKTMEPNKAYDLPTKILKDDGKVIVTMTFTDGTKTDSRIILGQGWTDNYIGRFIVYSDGTIASGETYPGVTTELLEAKKVKVTIDLATASGESGYKTGNPEYFNLFQFNKYGSGHGTVTVSFIANDIVY